MLQNTGNCVGFMSEIWEIKPPLCTSLNPLKKKTPKFLHNHLLWVPSLPPTGSLSKLKTKQENPSRNLFKDKADSL